MKKTLFVLVLFLVPFFLHAQTWISLGSSTPKEIIASVTESNSQSIRVLFDTEGFYMKPINEDDDIYQRLSIPGAGKTLSIGSPELPLFRQMVAVPECSSVSLSFQVFQEQELNNYNVYPAPDHQVVTNPDSTSYVEEVFYKNASCYSDNLVSPSNNVELIETGYFRSQKFVEIQVSPIRYNPATQKLYVATKIEVTLTLSNAIGPTSANLGIFNNVAAHTMLNYESTGVTAEVNDMRFGGGSVEYYSIKSVNDALDVHADYLIICASSFIETNNQGNSVPKQELLDFAQYRAYYNGYDVAIVNIDDVLALPFSYDDQDYIWEQKLRSFIQLVYDNGGANHTYDNTLGFVLLVGKAPQYNPQSFNYPYTGCVPTAYSHLVMVGSHRYMSDYWFSCLRNEIGEYDDVADLYIGRFCVENSEQLHNIVTKTRKRESEYNPKISKYVDAAIGSNVIINPDEYLPSLESIIGPNRTLKAVVFEQLNPYRDSLVSVINKGAPLLNINNHGLPNGWEGLPTILDLIDNSETMFQFCNSFSCNNGYITNSGCFAQTTTSSFPNKGFVGFLGASGDVNESYMTELPTAIYYDLSHILGECVLEAQLLHNDPSHSLRYQYNLIGDPALNIMAKGFEVTKELSLGGVIDIRTPIVIKDGGSILVHSKYSTIRFFDNGSITVNEDGLLSLEEGCVFDGRLANNPFISLKGGSNFETIGEGTSFNNTKVFFLNPSFNQDASYTLYDLIFNNTQIIAENLTLTISRCYFNTSSDVFANHCAFEVSNSNFNQSNIVTGKFGVIGLPMGATIPATNAVIQNCYFDNCESFEYTIPGNERAISNASIRLVQVPNYTIAGNVISQCIEGVYIERSGNGHSHMINENSIGSCSSDGVIIYNSYADLKMNSIIDNEGRGVSIYNNSQVSCYENQEPIGRCQVIGGNDSYQLYSSSNSFPVPFNYNKIVGDPLGDPVWVYFETTTTNTSGVRRNYVGNNNWDGNINFNENYVFNNPAYFAWSPFWYGGRGNNNPSMEESIYYQALQSFSDSLFAEAQSKFLQIINNYPESSFANAALKQLFRLEQFIDNDYDGLKNYYLTAPSVRSNSELAKQADFLSARCDVEQQNYELALDWYANQLDYDSISYQDSVFYVIDIGDIYLRYVYDSIYKGIQPSIVKINPNLLPESLFSHSKNTRYLLSTLPKNNDHTNIIEKTEDDGFFFSVFPNPAEDRIQINYHRAENNEMINVEIVDLCGRIVKSYNTKNENQKGCSILIDVSDIRSGIYICRLFIADNTFEQKRLIIK